MYLHLALAGSILADTQSIFWSCRLVLAWSLLGRGLVRPCGWWPLNWGQWCHRFPLAHQDLLLQSGRFSQRHSYFSISPLTPSKLWSLVIFGWILLKYVTDICTLFHFLAALAALYLHRWRTDWLKNHHSERSTRQCAHVWSDNLQLPYTSKLEVIWDQTTSDFLEFNLQLPYGHHGRHGHGGHVRHGRHG